MHVILKNPVNMYSVRKEQDKMNIVMRDNILLAHTITECDNVSALFLIEKK